MQGLYNLDETELMS